MLATPPRPSNNSKTTASPTDVAKHPDNNQETIMTSKAHPRTCILKVGSRAGQVCELAITHLPFEVKDEPEKDISKDDELAACMCQLLQALLDTATSLNLDLIRSIHNKMALNAKKYPVELCKGKAGKYTQYSNQTGITRDNQSTEDDSASHSPISWQQMADALPELTQEIAAFANARNWNQYHTPRNLVFAMQGEVGELMELVQWMGDDVNKDSFSPSVLDKLSQELADVTIYLLRLVTECKVVDEVCQALNDLNSE